MKLDDLRVQLRAHTVLSTTDLPDAQLNEFIWTTIERLQQGVDWHFQEQTTQFIFPPASIVGVPLPSNFAVEAAVFQVQGMTATSPGGLIPVNRLPAGRLDWAVYSTQPDLNESFPVPAPSGIAYYLWMNQMWIVPTPQTNPITIQMDYYGDPLAPSQPADELGLLGVSPRAVLWGALQLTYLYLHESEMAAAVGSIYDQLTDAALKREQGLRMGATKYTRTR